MTFLATRFNGWWLIRLTCFCVLLVACRAETVVHPSTRVLANNLLNPIGLAQLPDGGLLIA